MSESFEFSGEPKSRLDQALVQHLSLSGQKVSRSQVQKWIAAGNVAVNDTVAVKSGLSLTPGDEIEYDPVLPHRELEPYERNLEILFEDEWLLAVNKPPDLVVHPGAGHHNDTLLNALVWRGAINPRSFPGNSRPGIVHRLDRQTSGVILAAKDPNTHAALSEQFAERSVRKIYRALLVTTPRGKREIDNIDSGVIELPIGRDGGDPTKMCVRDDGRAARTEWKALERFQNGVLVEIRLHTGRTHQIRVHFAALGSPVVGDPVYGHDELLPKPLHRAAVKLGRQALHAAEIELRHPIKKESLTVRAPMPSDLEEIVGVFREVRDA